MKLNALTIRRFGRFERKQITLPDTPLVMIYGENESGKSTMMAFIVHQLFGFSGKKPLSNGKGTAIHKRLADQSLLQETTETFIIWNGTSMDKSSLIFI
ncbi:ATP-binding protein [Sporolactobacillus inulinus]|nr:AAA family ATPase [Sporolactobacillus inulinus]